MVGNVANFFEKSKLALCIDSKRKFSTLIRPGVVAGLVSPPQLLNPVGISPLWQLAIGSG